ncbi:MAG: hypothetical protein LBH82_06360 [Bacteroidales bacterium]|jgi:hypothetical protein|nr:hypothetical protein [Bacteroidales bacterium]
MKIKKTTTKTAKIANNLAIVCFLKYMDANIVMDNKTTQDIIESQLIEKYDTSTVEAVRKNRLKNIPKAATKIKVTG